MINTERVLFCFVCFAYSFYSLTLPKAKSILQVTDNVNRRRSMRLWCSKAYNVLYKKNQHCENLSPEDLRPMEDMKAVSVWRTKDRRHLHNNF